MHAVRFFTTTMSTIPVQDNSTVGIRATLNSFAQTLARTDPQIAAHLEDNGVKPQFYAFRWITLLLTQVGATFFGCR